MPLDDLINIRFVHKGIPGPFGIHHRHGPTRAAVQAASLVDANFAWAIQPHFGHLAFAMVETFFGSMVGTTVFPIDALVQTEKDVALVIAHARIVGTGTGLREIIPSVLGATGARATKSRRRKATGAPPIGPSHGNE